MPHFVDHSHHRRSQLLGAVGFEDGHRNVGLDAAELLQEIDVEVGAAELAVGDALQAHVFLELHDLGDGLVFHGAQLGCGDLARGFLLTGIQQVFGAQEAADVVGAKRWGGA
jgi:hypothetical protein